MTSRLPLVLILLGGCTAGPRPIPSMLPEAPGGTVGVLVMAHGGSEEWNETVAEAVRPVRADFPTAVAYGMADPKTLEMALDSLKAGGVERVALIRMFVSGRSFRAQTEYLLGLSDDRPDHLMLMEGDPAEARPIPHRLAVATHADGLMDSPQARRILVDRALALSEERSRESVLLLAHGMGDDAENREVLRAMQPMEEALESAGFAAVRASALREDWGEKRAPAEAEIRGYVADQSARGRRVLVIPMRLSGFGPYAEVLSGLEYTAGQGLLPHPALSDWIRGRARQVICDAGWDRTGEACGEAVAPPDRSHR